MGRVSVADVSVRGASLGDSPAKLEEQWGKPQVVAPSGLHLYHDQPRWAALFQDGAAVALYGDQIEAGIPLLSQGDSRDVAHRKLGPPTDPGILSSARPPHYESYDTGSRRLIVNFQGDAVSGFVLTKMKT